LSDPDFVIPTRGAYVLFVDDNWQSRDEGVPDGVLFSGYVSDEPEPVLLGERGGEEVWNYKISCTSEDYLLQIKELPSKTYINKTRGYIIKDLIATMFEDSETSPIDTSGVRDGGVERLYQTDRTKAFADMLSDFASADGFRYRILYGKLFYEPEAEILPASNDPKVKLRVDFNDPRFANGNLNLSRLATSIVNDVTIYGEDEPTNLVMEHFVSDGYQGDFQLTYVPYGAITNTLLNDDFTAPSFDTGIWQEQDDDLALTGLGDGSYIQLFEGSLNIVGGPGAWTGVGSPTDADQIVYLRARKGVELSGIIDIRDGELAFQPGAPDGAGIIGGLYTDESMKFSSLFSGWYVAHTGGGGFVSPIVNGTFPGITLTVDNSSLTKHYLLRRHFEFDNPIGLAVSRRGPLETDIVFGSTSQLGGAWITYTCQSLDFTDPQNVVIGQPVNFGRFRIENTPEFALFAPVVSYTLHLVMNFCKIWRPQQIRLTVNGQPQIVGDFIDGGVATVTVDDTTERAKLAWYSIPQADNPTDIGNISGFPSPYILWKLGDAGQHQSDSGLTQLYSMTANTNITSVPGAPSATVDQAKHFDGVPFLADQPFPTIHGPEGITSGFITHPSTGGFPVPFSITGWVRTTTADGGIFQYAGGVWLGFPGIDNTISMAVSNGRIRIFLERPEEAIFSTKVVNDGQWHHVVWTHDNDTSTSKIYIDGTLDTTGTAHLYTTGLSDGITWAVGYNNTWWPSLNRFIESTLVGDLDEIQIFAQVLTADQAKQLATVSQQPSTPTVPAYNPQTGVTIPPKGSLVEITYYRADKARARLRSTESIAFEKAKFGDDGVRQTTILADDVHPTPRSSEECQYLGQAFLLDRAYPRYEGTYYFEVLANNVTDLQLMPAPGDLIPVDLTLPTGEIIRDNILCTRVETAFLGDAAYGITLTFGPRTRFDEAQRQLMLRRESSLDNPEIADDDTLTAEVLNSTGYSIPDDPLDVAVSNITPLTFTVDMNPVYDGTTGGYSGTVNSSLPDGVVGYEVRRDDTGWGQANYVARVSAARFTLNRGTRDRAYFIKPFNLQNVFSRHSALVRVVSPVSNTIVVSGLDGDIDSQQIRLFIPVVRNPDIGGWLIQKDNADGPILYQGDGIQHAQITAGATILIENNRVTLTIPNVTAASTYTVRVLAFNLLGEFGPQTIFTITRPAPVIT
jgi:hypothetical protein